MSTHQDVVAHARADAFKAINEAENARGLYEIYRAHPEIRSCIANDNIIRSHFNGDTITLKDFDNDRAYGAMSGLATWSDTEKRAWLKKQIKALLPGSAEMKEAILQSYDAKFPHTDAYIVSTETMEAKLERLRVGKDHEDKSVEDLTAEVAQQRTITGGYPPLPPISKTNIRMMDAKTLANLIKRYGTAQINAVLAKAD